MPRIIHTADLHLDSPFSLLDANKAMARKAELRGTFSNIIAIAKNDNANMVIISGDLFDSEFVTKETIEFMNSQFSSVPFCKFVIAPGNHDCFSDKSAYSKSVFPKNVFIFNRPELQFFNFPDIHVCVYGWAFVKEDMDKNPLVHSINTDPDCINILAVHADTSSSSSKYCPISEEDIARSNCTYAALGHIHEGTEVRKAGNTYYAYSGCPEGRSFDECGKKGVISVDFEKNNFGRWVPTFSYKRVCKRRYEKFNLDITAIGSKEEVLAKIKHEMAKQSLGSDTLLRVVFTGTVDQNVVEASKKISAEDLGTYYLEIKDRTIPLVDEQELLKDITIKGALYRELLPKIKSSDPEESESAKQALIYGLAALSGSDVADF
ncbi:MAG: metallophosphoesterase [Clostridiales bacterium]|nr:metallophosphoesterase [Clostridiales bacterium]